MSRYKVNENGKKERDGFVVSSKSTWNFNCVAVKIDQKGSFLNAVQVRDTKDDTDTTLNFSASEWRCFIKGVKAGEFDIN